MNSSMFQWALFKHILNANPQFKGCSTTFSGADQKSLVFSPIFLFLDHLNPNPFFPGRIVHKNSMAVLTTTWLHQEVPVYSSFALSSVNEAHSPESQQISMWTGLGRTCTAVTTIVAISILSSTSLPAKPLRKKMLSRGFWKRESPIFAIYVTILCLKVIILFLKTTFFY